VVERRCVRAGRLNSTGNRRRQRCWHADRATVAVPQVWTAFCAPFLSMDSLISSLRFFLPSCRVLRFSSLLAPVLWFLVVVPLSHPSPPPVPHPPPVGPALYCRLPHARLGSSWYLLRSAGCTPVLRLCATLTLLYILLPALTCLPAAHVLWTLPSCCGLLGCRWAFMRGRIRCRLPFPTAGPRTYLDDLRAVRFLLPALPSCYYAFLATFLAITYYYSGATAQDAWAGKLICSLFRFDVLRFYFVFGFDVSVRVFLGLCLWFCPHPLLYALV